MDAFYAGGENRNFVRNNNKPVTQAEYDLVNEDLVKMTKSLLMTLDHKPGQVQHMDHLEKNRLINLYTTLNPKVRLEDVYASETSRNLERLSNKKKQ